MNKRVAVYPGSFDPVTYGHIDVVERGLSVFNEIIVLVAESSGKKSLFELSEKMEMLREVFKEEERVMVDHWSGLLVDYVSKKNISYTRGGGPTHGGPTRGGAILRGLRAISDFEYEFQMASMNKRLYSEVETFFVMTSDKYHFVSSSLVREVASLGGALKDIVPPEVEKRLREKF